MAPTVDVIAPRAIMIPSIGATVAPGKVGNMAISGSTTVVVSDGSKWLDLN